MKTSFYTQIRRNTFISYMLIASFFLIIVGLGWIIGFIYGSQLFATIIVAIFAFFYIIIMYFVGDSMILALSGAKLAQKNQYAFYVNTVEGLAIAAGIPTPKAYIIEEKALNAFATGRDPKHAAVTVTTGLLEKLNRQELEGVVAHEIAHIKNYDIRTMMLTTVLVGIVILLSDFLLRSFIFGAASNRGSKDGKIALIGIVVGVLLAILAPLIAQLIKLAVSRSREYVADAEGAKLTRNPSGLASALEKIRGDTVDFSSANKATEHMFISTPYRKRSRWVSNMFSTHPPIETRIAALKNM